MANCGNLTEEQVVKIPQIVDSIKEMREAFVAINHNGFYNTDIENMDRQIRFWQHSYELEQKRILVV